MMPPVETPSDTLDGPSLREVVSAVVAGIPFALFAAAVLAVAAYFASDLLPRRYEAAATLLASQPGTDLTRLGLPYTSGTLDLDTYVAAGQGSTVRQRAAESLDDTAAFAGVSVRVEPSRSAAARLVIITATAPSAESAAAAAGAIASALVAWDRERVGRDIEGVASVVEQQVGALRTRLQGTIATEGAGTPAAEAIRVEVAQRENELVALRAVAASPPATLQLLEGASVPSEPSSPDVMVNTVLGFALGFFLGLAAFLLRTSFDPRLRTVPAIERASGLPVLAALPRVTKDQGAYFHAMSYVAAALRSRAGDDGGDVVLVTSVREGAPRATAAIHLAACFVADGDRTLLVDANSHAPTIGQRLGIDRGAGPTTRMYADSTEDDTLDPTTVRVGKHAELRVVPSYPPPGGMDLGTKTSLAWWAERWRKEFDTVVLDTAPVLEAADSLGLARVATAVVLVVTPGSTQADELRQAVEALTRTGARIAGIVAAPPEARALARLGLGRAERPAQLSLASLGRA